MSVDQVRRFAFESVADGASGVFLNIARTMVSPEAVNKVRVFIDAAQRVGQLLDDGCPRHRLCEYA
jgi:hypothetical protein